MQKCCKEANGDQGTLTLQPFPKPSNQIIGKRVQCCSSSVFIQHITDFHCFFLFDFFFLGKNACIVDVCVVLPLDIWTETCWKSTAPEQNRFAVRRCLNLLRRVAAITFKMSWRFSWSNKMSHNIWCVFCVVLFMKYSFLGFTNHCILFLFSSYTTSQLFWTWGCKLLSYANITWRSNPQYSSNRFSIF